MWKRALHAGLDLYFASILPSALNILWLSRTMTSLIERTIAEQTVHLLNALMARIILALPVEKKAI